MHIQTLTIEGRLPTLNEYINAERTNRYMAAALKKRTEAAIGLWIKKSKLEPVTRYPINMEYLWCCPDRRTDKTNMRFAAKFIEDALQQQGIIRNDGWKEIGNIADYFTVDKGHPRIVVTLTEHAA